MHDMEWPGKDADPAGAEFFCFPASPPEGDSWAYIVDDFCVRYGEGTFWPYAADPEHLANWLRVCKKRGFGPPAQGLRAHRRACLA